MITLDMDLLRTFLYVAEMRSFTAAGAALGATQSAVSVRLKKLEDRLGRKLVERTPRSVALTGFGEAFVADARNLLTVHDDAVRKALADQKTIALSLGVSDHAAGARLPFVLSHIQQSMPGLQLSVTVNPSAALLEEFDQGMHDAVIVRQQDRQTQGDLLFSDQLVWVAAPELTWRPGQPAPLITHSPACGIRSTVIEALEAAGIAWTEIFSGGSVAAVQAAIEAGLGIACLGLRNKPGSAVLVGAKQGMPKLPSNQFVLLKGPATSGTAGLLDGIAEGFRIAGALNAA